MSKFRIFSRVSMAAFGLGLSISASATTVTLSTSALPGTFPVGTTTFDSTTTVTTPGFSFTGNSGIGNGNVYAQYAAPTGDTSPYAYADPGGLIVDTLAVPASSFSFYWGSVDSYNSIAINTTGGTFVFGQGGASLPAGVVMDGNNSYYVTFAATAGSITSVNFSSSTAAFEFDDVSSVPAAGQVPEPSSLMLLGTGMISLAGVARSRFFQRKR